IESFTKVVNTTIQEGLQNMNNLYAVMMLLKAVCSAIPRNIDSFMAEIIQVVEKLTNDVLKPLQNASTNIIPTLNGSTQPPDYNTSVLIMALQLVNSRICDLNEPRSAFLACLTQLVEKSKDIELLRTIFEMAKQWVILKTEPFPTIEEKANILVNMLCFESLDDKSLMEDYLNLVITIYTKPSFARTELTLKLERAFLIGTRNGSAKIRNKFMEIFDQSMIKSLSTRFNYVIAGQNWEPLAGYFWIHQAFDLLI
ncbi:16046_t:CDS:1, partial [Dentiscutata erythropus]